MTARSPRLEIAALCVGNALGSSGDVVQPFWVAALLQSEWLAKSQIGWLASGELFFIAVGTVAVSAFGQRMTSRSIAVAAAVVITLANTIAIFPAAQAVIMGRLLSGLGMGALLACVIGVATRRSDGQRVLALMQIGVVLLSSTLFFSSPLLIGQHGATKVFALLAGIGVVTVATTRVGMANTAPAVLPRAHAAGTWNIAPLLACIAMSCVAAGTVTLWTYIFVVGQGLGFDAHTIGTVLAMTVPIALLGPLAAHFLGERAGLLKPLLCALAVQALALLLIVRVTSPVWLGLCAAAPAMAMMFYVPYAMTFVSRIDPSGGFASATPAFILVGAAVGPKLGSLLIDSPPFHTLAAVAASCVMVGMLLFGVAARLEIVFSKRLYPSPSPGAPM